MRLFFTNNTYRGTGSLRAGGLESSEEAECRLRHLILFVPYGAARASTRLGKCVFQLRTDILHLVGFGPSHIGATPLCSSLLIFWRACIFSCHLDSLFYSYSSYRYDDHRHYLRPICLPTLPYMRT
ncbi:uncharacterized protein STEHIDRAFT_143977 [Stereum hirsutum FP-91666 SS1]|uniref:uncharacterized protein n=1 Tax=Stereum hirsutum (strain FP-91666) TaxID=721885 RepID=UPI000440A112|nr:uncharacterized protein STEHIDRAFT_143977 [Stereum hirsutum FP-91666 SS1]EIM92662.1 hypothetical protein STEHIDRAFT_143977 [Stereum hirsutum FP-91666 SS1]